MAAKRIVGGVESLWFAPAFQDYANAPAGSAWKKIEDLREGTVVYTPGSDNPIEFIPEDKDVAIVSLSGQGEPDTFAFSRMSMPIEDYADFFNVETDMATSTTFELAQRKVANLAIRLITRPIDGVKAEIIFPNTDVRTTDDDGPFTKGDIVQVSSTATVKSFKTPSGADGKKYKRFTNADGTSIDSTPAG